MNTDIDLAWDMMDSLRDITADEELKQCCDNPYYIECEGFCVCNNCGITTHERLFDDNTFTFNNGDGNMFLHQITNALYPESGKGTKISGNSRMSKINNWNSMPYKEKVIWEVSNELKSKLYNHFSDKVISDAIYIYKDIYTHSEIHRGNNKKGLIAACVYLSSKENNADKSPKQIAAMMGIEVSILNRCIKIFNESSKFTNKIIKSSDFIENFCSKMKISFKTKKIISQICDVIDSESILDGAIPQNICLGVVVFVCIEMSIDLDYKNICSFYSVSYLTITKIIKVLTREKQTIFSKIQNCK